MTASPLDSIRRRFAQLQKDSESASDVEKELLGRKGLLPEFLRTLKTKPDEERRSLGAEANALRAEIEAFLASRQTAAAQNTPLVDSTAPPAPLSVGGVHPISAMIREMTDVFRDLSFEVTEGPELVSDEDNFENLNLSIDHPARDGHDTFYVTDTLLMRTQTTAVQVIEMRGRNKAGKLPIRLVVPGKTFRRESDQTHSPMFHQFDAVMVDTETSFADLRGVLDYFAKRLFGDTVETRFRPHHFPFTEPSAEMDIRLKHVTGTGKHTGWLEFGGCGMVHPRVLERAGLNPKIYRGWAFGLSVERPLMLRHQIPDLRLLFENDPHFLTQFND